MPQQTILNGNRFGHVNLSLSFGNIFGGNQQTSYAGADLPRGIVKSLSYDAMQDAGIVQGNQVAILGRTSGYGTATGSLEVYVSEFDDFAQRLTNGGQFPILAVDFDLTASYSINDIDVRTDVLIGVRITKIGSSSQSGNDAHTKVLELNIAQLKLNGLYAFADASNA